MTTIAFDGSTMACDTLATGPYNLEYLEKIVKTEDEDGNPILMGFAGRLDHCIMLRDWVIEGMDKEKFPVVDEVEIIMATKDGCFLMLDSPVLIPLIGYPHAIGSGANMAMGAMLSGKSAVEAVEMAIKYDPGTGMKVVSFDLMSGDEEWENQLAFDL